MLPRDTFVVARSMVQAAAQAAGKAHFVRSTFIFPSGIQTPWADTRWLGGPYPYLSYYFDSYLLSCVVYSICHFF